MFIHFLKTDKSTFLDLEIFFRPIVEHQINALLYSPTPSCYLESSNMFHFKENIYVLEYAPNLFSKNLPKVKFLLVIQKYLSPPWRPQIYTSYDQIDLKDV